MNANRFVNDSCAVFRTIATLTSNRNRSYFRVRQFRTGSISGTTTTSSHLFGGDASSSRISRSQKNPSILSPSSFAARGRWSSSSNSSNDIPSLRGPAGGTPSLLQGLDIHTVLAEDDGHPLAVYTIQQSQKQQHSDNDNNHKDNNGDSEITSRIPVLLLHGRTWSSLPVYHLIGETKKNGHVGGSSSASSRNGSRSNSGSEGYEGEQDVENRSLLQALYNTRHNIQPYAMDFRGFGGTPRLSPTSTGGGGFVEPLQCVADAVSVLNWIRKRHHGNEGEEGMAITATSEEEDIKSRPALLGWSHGALIAQITAQRHPELVSKLILYGSIYNPHVTNITPHDTDALHTPRGRTDHDDFPLHEMAARNEYDGAMEDFTSIGSTTPSSGSNKRNGGDEARIFPPVSARLFAKAALVCDPIKVQWKGLHQLNECQPSLVKVPTLVIAGDQDPYAPISTQADLFTNLGRGVDKMWTIIANADHAVHLSDERHRFVENVSNFLRSTTT